MAAVPREIISQLRVILGKVFEEGQLWIKSTSQADWRRQRYISARGRRAAISGPSVGNIVDVAQAIFGYIGKDASNETERSYHYLIVKPEPTCLAEDGVALLRPVLKLDLNNNPQLNFHVWFHGFSTPPDDNHLMMGWRLEVPEGGDSTHNFFHAQPLRKFGAEESVHGLGHPKHSERFPSIPLPASNCVELCLTAILIACGKEAIRTFVSSRDVAIRKASRIYWSKVFGP